MTMRYAELLKLLKPMELEGVAAYHPLTGECFGAYRWPLKRDDAAQLLRIGAIIEVLPLGAVAAAFNAKNINPSRKILSIGKLIANYMGFGIASWIQMGDGKTYEYAGIYQAGNKIPLGCFVVSPSLLYKPMYSCLAA